MSQKYCKFFSLLILIILNINQIQNQSDGNQNQNSNTQNQRPFHFKAALSPLKNIILLDYEGIFTYNPSGNFTSYAGSITFQSDGDNLLSSASETGLTSFNEIKENNYTVIFAKNYVYFLKNIDDTFRSYFSFNSINGD